jgi:hypothetical protein
VPFMIIYAGKTHCGGKPSMKWHINNNKKSTIE